MYKSTTRHICVCIYIYICISACVFVQIQRAPPIRGLGLGVGASAPFHMVMRESSDLLKIQAKYGDSRGGRVDDVPGASRTALKKGYSQNLRVLGGQ